MQAGRLRRRITIEQPAETASARGGVTANWTTFLTTWAQIEPATAREVEAARQRWGEVSHKVTIRWPGASRKPTNKMRVNYTLGPEAARYFDIRGVINVDEQRRELNLFCVEHEA